MADFSHEIPGREFAYARAEELPQEVLMKMARLILPSPLVLPELAASFGTNSEIYFALEELFAGVPIEDSSDDFRRYSHWLHLYGPIFFTDLPPLFREPNPDVDESFDDDYE